MEAPPQESRKLLPDIWTIVEQDGDRSYLLKNGYVAMPADVQPFLLAVANHLGMTAGQVELMNEEIHRQRGIRPPKATIENRPTRSRFIYAMKNRRNGFCKIGISTNPTTREGTLQSEEPEIELLFSEPGTYAEEEFLHLYFNDKRVRGEWFNLSEDDLRAIPGLLANWRDRK